jgi:hypothetical protein
VPRIRTIKPEFWQDEKLSPCSPLTRLVFLGLISMADDAGRVLDNVKVIDAFIFPETSETSRGSIGELSGMGRIRRGITASGQRIIEITNWDAHQKIEKPNLRGALPAIVSEVSPPQHLTEIPRRVGEASGNCRGSVGEESPNHTNDQRPVPTTSTNDLLAPRQRSAPKVRGGRWPHFSAELCNTGYDAWLAKLGAVDYAQFRKAFGPVFNIPEAERPTALPRDGEFGKIIELYALAIRGTRAAQFAKPATCAGAASQLATAAREANTERRILLARTAMGTLEEQRRLEMAA